MRKHLLVAAALASMVPIELAAGRFVENPVQRPVRVHKGPTSELSPRQQRKARKAANREAKEARP